MLTEYTRAKNVPAPDIAVIASGAMIAAGGLSLLMGVRLKPDATTVSDTLLGVTVECYAGHRGEQTPRAITIADRRIEVTAVLDQWLAPNHRYFKLQADDGDIYLVRHDVGSGAWELTMFQRGRPQLSADR